MADYCHSSGRDFSFQNLGHTVDGIVLVYLVGTKLDPESRELWEREVVVLPKDKSSGKSKMPTSDQLLRFVQYRAKTLEHTPELVKQRTRARSGDQEATWLLQPKLLGTSPVKVLLNNLRRTIS